MTQPAIPRWDTPWLLPLSTKGFYRAGVGAEGGGTWGSTRKSLRPTPTPLTPRTLLTSRSPRSSWGQAWLHGLARLGM